MKLNIEIKPKEWASLVLFMLISYLLYKGDVAEAVTLAKGWFLK
jgi:hypothetical protein